MDVYDPACPTEDETQFTELDLSQVPLPPSFPVQSDGSDRDVSLLPSDISLQPATEERKGRRKRKKKRKHDEPLQELDDEEENETEDNAARLENSTTEAPLEQDAHDVGESSNVELDSGEGKNQSKQELPSKPPAAHDATKAVSSTPLSPAASTKKPEKLHFKLTPDPSGGKAKVSFQLKKSMKSSIQSADGTVEESAEAEKKDVIEKTAAEEYMPTRFKVSKKHEMFRPSQVEGVISVVISSPTVKIGGVSKGIVPASQVLSSNVSQPSLTRSQESVVKDSGLAREDDTRSPSSLEADKSEINEGAKTGMKEEEIKEASGKRDSENSSRGLRRSARQENRQVSKDRGKEDSPRSMRRRGNGDNNDTEKYGSSRSSYSKRERNEETQKDQNDRRRRAEDEENADGASRSLRSRKNEHETKSEDRRSSNKKQENKSRNDKHVGWGKSDEPKQLPQMRRTRSSQRRRSNSQEKGNEILSPSSLGTEKATENEHMPAPGLEVSIKGAENELPSEVSEKNLDNESLPDEVCEKHMKKESEHGEVSEKQIEKESMSSEVFEKQIEKDSFPGEVSEKHIEKESEHGEISEKHIERDSPASEVSEKHLEKQSLHSEVSDNQIEKDPHPGEVSETHTEKEPADVTSTGHPASSAEKSKSFSNSSKSTADGSAEKHPHIHKIVIRRSVDSNDFEIARNDVTDVTAEESSVIGKMKASEKKEEKNEDFSDGAKYTKKERAKEEKVDLKGERISEVYESIQQEVSEGSSTRAKDKKKERSKEEKVSLKGEKIIRIPEILESLQQEESEGSSARLKDAKKEKAKEEKGNLKGEKEKRGRVSEVCESSLDTKQETVKGEKVKRERIQEFCESLQQEESEGSSARMKDIKKERAKEEKSNLKEEKVKRERIQEVSESLQQEESESFSARLKDTKKERAKEEKANLKGEKVKRQRIPDFLESLQREVKTEIKRSRSLSSEDERGHSSGSDHETSSRRLPRRRAYNPEPALPPEQVLVDVSALPGKSKWEMDDDDDEEGNKNDSNEDIDEIKTTRNEGRPDLRNVRVYESRWQYQNQAASTQQAVRRTTRMTEGNSFENDAATVHEHKKHKDKKKHKHDDRAEKKHKKKKRYSSSEDNNRESQKTSSDNPKYKEKENLSKSKTGIDNSKIVSYLKEYSTKEEKTPHSKADIDSVKLVAYLKEYSGKMATEPSLNSSDDVFDPDSQGNKEKSVSSRIVKSDEVQNLNSQKNENLNPDAADKHKEQGSSEISTKHSKQLIVDYKGESSDESGEDVKGKSLSSPSRSTSNERSHKESGERRLKGKNQRSESITKERRERSSSLDRKEKSASQSSRSSRDRRNRSRSSERNRRGSRNRSLSSEKQDQSARFSDRRRNRRQSRSRSPSWRERYRRNRSRSTSGERRNYDRGDRSWSRSRERSHTHRSHRSPSYGKTRQENRDRRGRSRSNSFDRSSDRRRRNSGEESHRRASRDHRRSSSPDKKKAEVKSDARKGQLNVSEPVDLSSIPIPDDVPLPDEMEQGNRPDEGEEHLASQASDSVDKSESRDSSDEVKERVSSDSVNGDIQEAHASGDILKESESKDIDSQPSGVVDKKTPGISAGEAGDKEKTSIKLEKKPQIVNPATLSSGKERQIKFSIMGSRRLRPAIASDILDDDDDKVNREHHKEEVSPRPSELSEVLDLVKNDQPTHQATDTVSECDPQEICTEKIKKSNTEDAEIMDTSESEHEEIPLIKSNAKTDLTLKADDQPKSESVGGHIMGTETETVDSDAQKFTNEKELETSTTTPASQKLKFKYVPLWEMEELEIKPAIEVQKKPENTQGLALDYGSDSSEEADGESVSEQTSIKAEAACPANENTIREVQAESLVEVGQDNTAVKISHDTEHREEVQDTESATVEDSADNAEEPSLRKCDPSETATEAYSPSHPSLEDSEDILDQPAVNAAEGKKSAVEDRLPSIVDRAAVKSVSLETPVVSSQPKAITSFSASQPVIQSHPMPSAMAGMPNFTNSLGSACMNIAQIPFPGMNVPQVPQPVRPPGSLPAVMASLIGQPLPRLHMPLSQASIFPSSLSMPQPVPPPPIGMQPSVVHYPRPVVAPRPVPPPGQLNAAALPQSALGFSIPALTPSLTAIPPVTPPGQLMQDRASQIHGTLGFQGAPLSGSLGVSHVPAPVQAVTLPVVRPNIVLPLVGVQQGGTLPGVSVGAQSTSSSSASTGLQYLGTNPETGTGDTNVVKFRINRFHQGPPAATSIPPPSVAIPPPSLTLPSLWGTSPAVTSTTAPASLVSTSLTSQQPSSSAEKILDTARSLISTTASQRPPLDQQVSTTHSKRPKISSILSQPKISDPSVLETLALKDKAIKRMIPTADGQSTSMGSPSAKLECKEESLPTSENPPEEISDSDSQKTKPDSSKQLLETRQEYDGSVDREACKIVQDKADCMDQTNPQSQLSRDAIQASTTATSTPLEGSTKEQPSASAATLAIDMENIPLPGEVLPHVEETTTSSPIPPKLSEKTAPPLPPSPPPHNPSPPAAVPDSSSSSTTSSSTAPVVGSLLADRKKRFSQSPLAIGMLPKIPLTQSPLAAGPLPKLSPEPEDSKPPVDFSKKKPQSLWPADTKPSIQISSSSSSPKQKKPQAEKDPKSKVHFVFKSKTVIQKTVIPGFEDEGSDESDSGGGHQEAPSDSLHADNSLLSLFAETKEEVSLASSLSRAASSAEADTRATPKSREASSNEGDADREHKSKVSSTIEAFPVQVITSSRKEEVTPASSWPEFAVGKVDKRGEDFDKDECRRSSDREEKRKKKHKQSSRDREKDDDREERKRSRRHEDEDERNREENKRSRRYEDEDDRNRGESKRSSRYEDEEDRKDVSRRKGERRRSDDEDDDDGRIRIKKEKDDYFYDNEWGGRQDQGRVSDRRRGYYDDEEDDYNKRRRRYDDDGDYRKERKRDVKDEDAYNRRRSGDDRDDSRQKRKFGEENRRSRHFERDRSRDRSRERERSQERDKHDRSNGKSGGKRSRRSRDRSHSRSPSRRKDKGRNRSRERFDRDRSRSHSQERTSSSSRKKDSRSFKEELMEELSKTSAKSDSKDEHYKVTVISSSSQVYVPEYQEGPAYSGTTDSSTYALAHHGPEVAAGYQGQDPSYMAQYSGAQYDHQQYGPHWQGQPAHGTYSQAIPPQHQDIHSHYPPMPLDQASASHEYPYQPQQAHYPTPSYPPAQMVTDPYHPLPAMLQQQPLQSHVQHPTSMPQAIHIPVDQHGQVAQQPYPGIHHPIPTPYPQVGPPRHFHPQSFPPQTFSHQESAPHFPSPDFNLQPVLHPRAALLPLPPRAQLLKASLLPRSGVDSPRFSSPEQVSSPNAHKQPDIWSQRKSKLVPPEEATSSPVLKSAVVTSSSPSVGSPSTPSSSSSSRIEAPYKKSDTEEASSGQLSAPEPTFETSSLAEAEFDSVDTQGTKVSSQAAVSKKRSSEAVNEPTVSSSGVEDSTGDTGSDSGTDSSSQKPLKVKSRWRRNSEAEAVVDTSTPVPPLAKQLLGQGSTPNDTPDSSPKEKRRTRSRAAAEEMVAAAALLTETLPPPPPPRKRIKADPDAADLNEKVENDDMAVTDVEGDAANEAQDLASLMKRPDFPKFEIITENIHLTERKRSKSMKRMLCDCTTSRDERSKGIVACGSDCLNRMLMIECGSRCPCGEHCTNKRFQKKQYSNTIPFSAGEKGWGLRAEEDMEEKGTFIMEYVGELLNYEEFVRRTRQYSKAGLVHHYFMALNADEVVDATLRGSISRFINHSCDPNCETQKWTVNGELRVGFFTKKTIKKGEELTFDYQFEHYGEAQKCYCGAENCRGYIGLVKSPTRNNKRKEKKKREIFKDELLEEDIEQLSMLDGMRNKNHVLELCRLMVRAEKAQHRMAILKILQDTTETACLRLFLDYHGLPLFWSWMADIGTTDYSAHTQELKLLMLSVLKSLPITNRTALRESKIPDVVERWAVAAVVAARKPPPPPPPTSTTTATTASTAMTDSTKSPSTPADNEADVASSETAAASAREEAGSTEEEKDKAAAVDPEATTSSESSPPASPTTAAPPPLSSITPVSILASAKDSKDAKRKRRVTFAEVHIESQFSPDPAEEESDDISSSTQSTDQQEGEVAANRDAGFELKPGEALSSEVADSTSYDRNSNSGTDTDSSDTESLIKDPLASLAAECISLWSSLKEVFKIPKKERVEERKRTERELDVLSKKELEISDPFAKWKRSKVTRLSKKKILEDDEKKLNTPKMSKEERRQLFEAQVKAEDELAAQAYAEEYQRQQEAYVLHQQRLLEDPQYFYFHQQQGDPNFVGIDPNMVPPEGLIDPVTGQPIPSDTLINPHTGQPVIDPSTGQPMIDPNTGHPIVDPNTGQPFMHHHQQLDPNTGHPIIDPSTGQPVLLTHHVDLHTGQPMQHIDPHTGQLMDPHTGQPVQHVDPLTGQPMQLLDPHTGQPVQHIDPLTGQPIQHIDPHTGQPLHHVDPVTGQPVGPHQIDPITGQPIEHQMDPLLSQPVHPPFDPHVGMPVKHQHSVQSTPDFQHQPPSQQLPVTTTAQMKNLPPELEFEEEVPPPPSPPTVPVTKLPPNWKTAKDAEGRVYYYHAFTRQTQWEMPSWEDNDDDSDDMDLDPLPAEEIIKSKKKTTTAAADTSSEVARKIKDQFRSKMSNFIVAYLNPYRKQDCKIGRIVSTEDFKHLARKLTHHVMSKELKHCRHVEDLEVNENVKAKAKDYVRKYMSKFGTTFKKSSSPHLDESFV